MASQNKTQSIYNKWPRQYALEISVLETREQRLAALMAVPVDLRPITKTHIDNMFLLRASKLAEKKLYGLP